jgi:hypothetical protein
MLYYIYSYIKMWFYGPYIENKIYIKDVKTDTCETFIYIKPQKLIEKSYNDYKTIEFLNEIKNFKFSRRPREISNNKVNHL